MTVDPPSDPSSGTPPAKDPRTESLRDDALEQARAKLLLLCVLAVATCGLVYELISATIASYLLGDSVTQFSLVIGVYLSAMGVGSWLSRFVVRRIEAAFVQIQLSIALLGGCSAAILFLGFAYLSNVRPVLFTVLALIGVLVGLEIPLIMRIMPSRTQLKDLVARVLAFDYIGSLLASLVFPLVMLPRFGLVTTSFSFGLLNAIVALWSSFRILKPSPRATWLRAQSLAVVAVLVFAIVMSPRIESFGESQLFAAPIALTKKTPYQRLTLTRRHNDLRLYLNGNLQFSSRDEYRYHEALVHPALENVAEPERILVLGGGDGMAAREILKYPEVKEVVLVDLDPEMTRLFRDDEALAQLNQYSLRDPRVNIENDDALMWLEANVVKPAFQPFDAVIVDFPDPNNFSLGKLYTLSFYGLLHRAVKTQGAVVIQSTSPHIAPTAFWCIEKTVAQAGFYTHPFHAMVPSFGEWGFVFATPTARPSTAHLRPDIPRKYLDDHVYRSLFVFPPDRRPDEDIEVNRLNEQKLVQYYEQDISNNWIPGGP